MLSGRKLLLADDSAAIQKVIELTFADEGMEVASVGDGGAALEKLEYFTPDVVLADAFMPGMNGYELCRSIKDNQRLSEIPVMLLVSSFEPFDEAEAKRAGADDIVTKPFQSIRQLVRRVGSLVSGDADEREKFSSDYSTLGLGSSQTVPAESNQTSDEPEVTVLVEAEQMETIAETERHGPSCAADVELQTADTQRLEPIVAQAPSEESNELQFQDTLEIEPVGDISEPKSGAAQEMTGHYRAETTEPEGPRMPAPISAPDESLLEIEGVLAADAMAGDVILDLDDAADQGRVELPKYAPAVAFDPAPEAVFDSTAHQELLSSRSDAMKKDDANAETESVAVAATTSESTPSPEVIDAIARRVVEQMSDKVVREIAWEVVPELSELLIKQKLDEHK